MGRRRSAAGVRQARTNRVGRHPGDGETLAPAAAARHDADRPTGDDEPFREERHQRFVRGALHRRCGQTNDDGFISEPGDFGPARAGYHADVDLDASGCVADQKGMDEKY